MRTKHLLILFTLALGLMWALAWPVAPGEASLAAPAATFTVTNTNDSGPGSLRQAVADAGDGDTINFSLTYPATITLTGGEIRIDKDLTITGPGASNLTINGNDASHVFQVGYGRSLTISGVSIAHGSDSGILNNGGTLTASGCTFRSNTTGIDGSAIVSGCTFVGNDTGIGGVPRAGSLSVTDSTFSGHTKGGISAAGTVTVTNSIFSDNSDDNGAGISFGDGTMTVISCTFSGNTATSSGGGIYIWGVGGDTGVTVISSTFSANTAGSVGGGIVVEESTLTVTNSTFSANSATSRGGAIYTHRWFGSPPLVNVVNSTFSGNSAPTGGGIAHDAGTLTVVNSTFSGNQATGAGGGIHNDASAAFTNTIVANSPGGGNCSGSAFAAGSSHNLTTDGTCSPGFTQVTAAQLALGTPSGSPAYYPLNPGSAAIDAGTNAGCPAADQRGAARPQDGDGDGTAVCDVGSYEREPFIPTDYIYLPLVLRGYAP